MVYYMQFTHCMFNQSAINNHAVINMQCPPYNVMFGSNLGAGGLPGGYGLQGEQVPLQRPGQPKRSTMIKQNLEDYPADDQPAAEGIIIVACNATLQSGCYIAKADPFPMELEELKPIISSLNRGD